MFPNVAKNSKKFFCNLKIPTYRGCERVYGLCEEEGKFYVPECCKKFQKIFSNHKIHTPWDRKNW